ncbi:MAG: DEAD/DEAH box helicase [Chloroflexi bacterium]|nr:DEAD/DEAH box helicase [Chloroflexota bacterium]
MRDAIVALDLETTGLNKDEDAIIEIGAARFQDGELLDTFSYLINPGRNIPDKITALTGIRTEDLLDAPRINDVLPDLRRFIGTSPVVGHRIDFDLGFLNQYRVAQTNLAIDTYDLASVMLPTTPRYNLNHLTGLLNLELEQAHRALHDAIATGQLYWTLWQRVMNLPLLTLQEIVEACGDLNWSAAPVFLAAFRERSRTALVEEPNLGVRTPLPLPYENVFQPPEKPGIALEPSGNPRPLDVDTVAAVVERDGAMAQVFPEYEHRPQQVSMLRAVATAFSQGDHLMVEAPTGVGKSLAYLIPAVYWAVQNGERVVISTATLNLQDQLIQYDLPVLARALRVPFRAAVVKGRSHYLCPRRLATLRRRKPTAVGELRVLAKILVWLLESTTGEKSEISLRGFEENVAWARLSAEDEGCTLDRCRTQMRGACPFYKARLEADSAHVLIVNHALLLSDVSMGSRVLPEYNYLIVDEAHHLEEATTNGLSFQINRITFQRQLSDLGDARRGLLGDVIRGTRGSIPPEYFKQVEEFVDIVSNTIRAMGHHVDGYFEMLYEFLDATGAFRTGDFLTQVRITPELRQKPGWTYIEEAWHVLSQFTQEIAHAMRRLTKALVGLRDFDVLDYDDLLSSVQAAARHLTAVHEELSAFSSEPLDNTIYWVQVEQDRAQLSIHTAPLNVGPLLEEYLWQAKTSVILTSATLRTGGSFEYLRDRLNAFEVNEAVVGSPFDYKSTTLVYVPVDIPSPDRREDYQRAVERGIIELAAATNGRMLALFTSYAQLRQTAQAIAPRLALGDITVFDQSDGTSRQGLLDGFKQTEKAVLLGTRSFWEGVDIPGDDLSVLVIVRLPFSVPTDPIFAARSEQFENSFMQYAVPDAVLRFRQGFGRLIRTRNDRGVVVLLDNRVITKRYGQVFLDSLPECTVVRGRLADLPHTASAWLAREQAE